MTRPSKFPPAFSVKSVSLYSPCVKLYWLNYNGSLNSSFIKRLFTFKDYLSQIES